MNTPYYDAHSRAVFKAFEEAVKPVLAATSPSWLLHHMEISRREMRRDRPEEVEIVLVLRPLGEANIKNDNSDLNTGYKRLGARK
jgi:hypothetical protein